MISRFGLLTSVFALFVAASSLAGCSFEPGERTQLAGQECFSDDQCVEGLVCVERVCLPQGGVTGSDAGNDADVDDPVDAVDVPQEDAHIGDVGQDAEQICEPGAQRCGGRTIVEICVDDGTRYAQRDCEEGLVCQGGRCVDPNNNCTDRDGDGYCIEEDCDDSDRSINPAVMESCDTPYDDNCDGRVNETCTECCAGGCGDNQFCSNCQCVPVDRDTCQYQDQPCNREGWNNGFYCTNFEGSGQMRCLGICERRADDPDSTCPNAGSVCAFGGDGEQGICLSGCTLSQGCGVPGYGCLPYDGNSREGICVPTNPNRQVGESCNPDTAFDCEEGAICVEQDNGPRCVEACRPFSTARSPDTDCDSGHCFPFSPEIGTCRPDAGNRTEGDQCRQRQILRSCNQDSVSCFPSGGFQGPKCTRFCRLDEGNADCNNGQTCYQYEQRRDDIGVCIDGLGP